jgi:hypothetical protein
MVVESSKLAVDVKFYQQAVAGDPVGIPYGCHLPSSPCLKIDLQTREAVCLGLCLKLLYQISNTDNTQKWR